MNLALSSSRDITDDYEGSVRRFLGRAWPVLIRQRHRQPRPFLSLLSIMAMFAYNQMRRAAVWHILHRWLNTLT